MQFKTIYRMSKTDECSFYFSRGEVDCTEDIKIYKSSKEDLKNLIIPLFFFLTRNTLEYLM